MCVRGVWGLLGDTTRTNGITDGNINILYARVREGHPTPLPIAMQTRHIFCTFRLSAWDTLRTPRVKAEKPHRRTGGDHFANR